MFCSVDILSSLVMIDYFDLYGFLTGQTAQLALPSSARTIRIRFLDELSPGAQQKYYHEQEKRREEKKTKLDEIPDNGGSSSNIDTNFEQPLASLLASQTAENTEYNRYFTVLFLAK